MSRYRLEVVTESDGDDLRKILAATGMEGDIRLALAREPDYFQGAQVEGEFRQVIAARDTHSGRLVGFGARTIGTRFLNGRPQPIGYLSQLRVLPEHRRRGLVARGYALLRELHADGRTPLYLTTIARDNRPAMELLTSGRAGLPHYQPAGDYHTLALPITGRRRAKKPLPGIELRAAEPTDVAEVQAFVQRCGEARQLFPCYTRAELEFGQGRLHGLSWSNLWLARRRGKIVGMIAGWDQRAFRQIVVQGYARRLATVRPVYNIWARMAGRPPLPPTGASLPAVALALPLVDDVEPALLDALVERVAQQQAAAGASILLLGLHASDPLLPQASRWPATRYTTGLFYAYWPDGAVVAKSIDARPTYLELGCL